MKIQIYDTTLRDGTQGESVAFSVQDKLRVARKLDEFGIGYIEGGWPGSNDKDYEFFHRAASQTWHTAKIAAFGSTAHAGNLPDADPNLQALQNSWECAGAIQVEQCRLYNRRSQHIPSSWRST